MLAVLYLCVCAITGMLLLAICVPDVRRLYLACAPSLKAIENIPSTLFVVSAGTVTGMMIVPFVHYFVILALSYFVASDKLCMKIGFMVTAALFFWLVLTCLIVVNKRRIKKEENPEEEAVTKLPSYVNKPSNTLFYSFVILAVTVTAAFLMFYTYRIDRGYLLNGYSTFSDLSPHTAMVSSFGTGFNFPTEYMHFSGDGIKYHFMFYFLAGMLQYLGFPIDYALNIPSIIVMVCAMILLGLLATLLSGRRLAFALSPVLVFFRSSLNVFIHIRDLMGSGKTLGDALTEIMYSNAWYGVTDYDNWGIWAINVYPNQRHLMLGVAAVLICVILFLPFLRRLCISAMSAGSFGGFFKAILFSRNAWLPRTDDPLSAGTVALYVCVMVIVMPYFHGSCLIALLLVLFGMALFSESRLLHLMVAVCAVVSSFILTLTFSGGAQNVVKIQFNPGFILSEKSNPLTGAVLVSWAKYLAIVTGATLLVAAACTVFLLFHDIVKKKPVYRFFLIIAFLNPLIFAFFFQVTLEMLANHKFIQVSIILIDAFVAIFLANLFVVPGRRKAVALAADVPADAADKDEDDEEDDDEDEDEDEEKSVFDDKALEANIEKAEKEGELAPVILEKEEPKEIRFGDEEKSEDDEEGPFEVLDDEDEKSEEKSDGPVEITDDKPEEESEDESEDKSKDESEERNEEKTEEASEEKSEAEESKDEEKSEDDSDKEETDSESSSDEDVIDDSDDAEVALERTPADPAITKKLSFNGENTGEDSEEKKEESIEETEELPFEVLDDEEEEKDEKKSEESKELKTEDDKDKDGLIEEDDPDNDGKEDVDDDDDLEDMVLDHHEVASEKAKGMPVPVWIFFEFLGVVAGLILLTGLVATGISEWATYVNLNSTPMAINTNSPVTEWVIKNTEPDDVFLTPEWSMDRFLLTGRPMYYGWPYYAWSAGHDTNKRDTIYLWLISGCGGDIKEFKRYCKERGIRYLIADPEFEEGDYGDDVFFNREFFEENLQQVAYFTEEKTVIYKIY